MVQIFDFAGYGFAFIDAITLLIYLSIGYQFIFQKRSFAVPDKKLIWSLFGLIFAYIFSLIGILTWGGEQAIMQFFKTISHFIFVISIAIFALTCDIDIKAYFKAIQVLLYLSIIINLYAVYQLFARMFGLPWAYVEISNVGFLSRDYGTEVGEMKQIVLTFQNFYRATSIFSEPSSLALFNIWMLLFLLIPVFTNTKPFIKKNGMKIFIGILSIISLLLTFSLTGLAMLAVMVLIFIFLEKVHIRKYLVTFFISVIILSGADYFLKDYTQLSILELFGNRVAGIFFKSQVSTGLIEGESAPQRIKTINNAWNLFLESPIFGIGAGNTYNYPGSEARFADSSLFHIMSETGLVGLFFFGMMILYSFKVVIYLRKYRYRTLETNPELSTMQSIVMPLLILMVFQNLILANLIGIASFWLYYSIILATYRASATDFESKNL